MIFVERSVHTSTGAVSVSIPAVMDSYRMGFLFVCSLLAGLGETLTFECFKDRCERRTQYCVAERRRCYNCEDMKDHCGTQVMPRDCDGYCTGLTVKDLESRLNERLEEIHRLNRTLNTERDNSEREHKIFVDDAIEMKLKLEAIETALNESKRNYTMHEEYYKELESNLRECRGDSTFTIVIVVLTILLIVLLGLVVASYKVMLSQFWRSLCATKNQSKEPEIPVSFEESGREETCVLIPPDITITDKTDEPSDISPSDSGVEINSDNTSNVTTNSQDAQSTDRDRGTESEVRAATDDNCLRKNTPAALKGIPPTVTSNTDLSKPCYNE